MGYVVVPFIIIHLGNCLSESVFGEGNPTENDLDYQGTPKAEASHNETNVNASTYDNLTGNNDVIFRDGVNNAVRGGNFCCIISNNMCVHHKK